MEKWQPRMLMITLGGHGMLLAGEGAAPRHVPTRAREVFDLSGAGDTVIATCMLALASARLTKRPSWPTTRQAWWSAGHRHLHAR